MTPDEFQVLVSVWQEALASVSDVDLLEACALHVESGRYFPCPADILRPVREKQEHRLYLQAVESGKELAERARTFVYTTPMRGLNQ
jgi:hypothetical protein